MKKYYLEKNSNSKFLVDLLIYENDILFDRIELKSRTTDNYLKFPQNDLDIKYMNYDLILSYLDKESTFEITRDNFKKKYSNFKSNSTQKLPQKSHEDILNNNLKYLDDEDEREIFKTLYNKIIERKREEKERKILEDRIEKMEKEYNELLEKMRKYQK
jgi:hypothetical protein